METLWSEARHILIRFVMLLILAPLTAYVMLQCIEDLQKAWKSQNKKKKWRTLTLCLIYLGIMFGFLQ